MENMKCGETTERRLLQLFSKQKRHYLNTCLLWLLYFCEYDCTYGYFGRLKKRALQKETI